MLAERERLAREIHDTLAQGFTSVVVLLELAESDVDTDPAAARRRLATARETARQNLAEARALVAALSPADLQAAPLPEAIGRLVDRFGAETGLPARLAVTGEPQPLAANREVVLLRSAQEALANVRKHAGAGRVEVSLDCTATGTSLAVLDDGSGFDPAAPTGGYGLAGMRRRVEEIGGTLCRQWTGPGPRSVGVRCMMPVVSSTTIRWSGRACAACSTREPDLEVVGEAGSGEEAVALAARLRPDVVLMDLRMPGTDGVAATAQIARRRRRPGAGRHHVRHRRRHPAGGRGRRDRLPAQGHPARASWPTRSGRPPAARPCCRRRWPAGWSPGCGCRRRSRRRRASSRCSRRSPEDCPTWTSAGSCSSARPP